MVFCIEAVACVSGLAGRTTVFTSWIDLKGTSRYQRSTTAISIVAPICYAHLAATQMGQFMKFEDLSNISSGKGSVTSSESIPVQELPRLHGKVQGSMFFC